MAPISKAEWEVQLRAAEARSRESRRRDPRAVRAHFDPAGERVVVELTNGCAFAFPAALAEGLCDAPPEHLAEVEVSSAGLGLHWERLAVDLTVAGLLQGVFGTRRWMSELGRLGGQATSAAKARAARANGKKGGRPRTPRPDS